MDLLYIIAFIVLIVFVKKNNDNIEKQKTEIEMLQKKSRELYERTFYNYRLIIDSKHTNNDKADDVKEKTDSSFSCRKAETPGGSDERNVSQNVQNTYAPPEKGMTAAGNYFSETVQKLASIAPVVSPTERKQPTTAYGEPIDGRISASVKESAETGRNTSESAQKTEESVPMSVSQNKTSVIRDSANIKVSKEASKNMQSVDTAEKNSIKANGTDSETVQRLSNMQPMKSAQKNIPNNDTAKAQTAQSADTYDQKPKEKNFNIKSIESWIGVRFFNIVASLLVFIGLVLFVTISGSAVLKIAAMYVISGALTALGAILTKKSKSIFSLGLTGCGLGALFISILLTHIYFHVINDVAAFSLLLIWTIFSLFMSKRLNSSILSVTAHMGMAISVCFAFSMGFSAERIILPVIYQMASIAVIVFGNIFCCRKTYRFGLLMSMALLVYSSSVMYNVFSESENLLGGMSVPMTAVLFGIQVLAISFLSYLLSVSTASLLNQDFCKKYPGIPQAIHLVNKSLWTIGVFISAGKVVAMICCDVYKITSDFYPAAAVGILGVCHLAVTLYMSEKLNFNEKTARISIWFSSVLTVSMMCCGCIGRERLSGISFVFIFTAVMLLIIKCTKNRYLSRIVIFSISAEAATVVFYSFYSISKTLPHASVISIFYTLIIFTEVFALWLIQDKEVREKTAIGLKVTEYLWISLAIILISAFADIGNKFQSVLIFLCIFNILVCTIENCLKCKREILLVTRIGVHTIFYISLVPIWFANYGMLGDSTAVKITLLASIAVLLIVSMIDLIKTSSTGLAILAGINVSVFISSLSLGYANMSVMAYIYSSVLSCRPAFFIFAVIMLIIAYIRKNKNLSLASAISLGIDMLTMLFFGYSDLCTLKISGYTLSVGLALVCLVYLVITCMMIYLLWYIQPEKERAAMTLAVKAIAYFWTNASLSVICWLFVSDTEIYKVPVILILLNAAQVIAYVTGFCGRDKSYLSIIYKFISGILVFVNMYNMTFNLSELSEQFNLNYAVRVVLILLSTATYCILIKDFIKLPSIYVQVALGITFTIYINAVCRGISSAAEIAYIFSIICMFTALVCIAAGFITNGKGLRMYGLVVVMICVLKLVTFDINAANSSARVLAFIVGGIICFAVSGIYNRVEKKYAVKQTDEIDGANEQN